ncbi:MAG: 50S ribosomal protein L21 [Alphaproteobacteria bacterium]|nr:50S ribosomal protein L21 [Alphaproteobacteria bacterium]MDP6812737.1 50S ribosomal protein L21 [Alphaproteobacteria bacterium]
MFAVIKTGGKQYRVKQDDVIRIERIAGEAGDEVAFDDVLMLGDDKETKVGTPLLDGAKVLGTVLEQARGEKIIVFKKKRRKGYRRRQGHRQELTLVRITDIAASGAKKKAAAKAKPAAKADDEGTAETKAETKTATAKKPAAKKEAAKKAPAKKAAADKGEAKAKPKAKAKASEAKTAKKLDEAGKAADDS